MAATAVKMDVKLNGFKQVAFPKDHNWSDCGDLFVCRECSATIELKQGYSIYTPGNGECNA